MKDFRSVQSRFKQIDKGLRLESDPATNPALMQREQDMHEALKPLIAELAGVGILVDSVFDLVMSSGNYSEGLPILAKSLRGDYPTTVRAGIARAMGVPEALPYWDLLVQEFVESAKNKEFFLNESLGLALVGCSQKAKIPELVELVKATPPCVGRRVITWCLKKLWRNKEVWEFLVSMKDDPDLQGGLGKWIEEKQVKQARKGSSSQPQD